MRLFWSCFVFASCQLVSVASCAQSFLTYDPSDYREVIAAESEGWRRGSMFPVPIYENVTQMYVSYSKHCLPYLESLETSQTESIRRILVSLLDNGKLVPEDLGKYCRRRRDTLNKCMYCNYAARLDDTRELKVALFWLPGTQMLVSVIGLEKIASEEEMVSVLQETFRVDKLGKSKIIFSDKDMDDQNAYRGKRNEPLLDKGTGPETFLFPFENSGETLWARGGRVRLENLSTGQTTEYYGITVCKVLAPLRRESRPAPKVSGSALDYAMRVYGYEKPGGSIPAPPTRAEATEYQRLINQAHQYDSMYCASEQAERDKAVQFYLQAVELEPNNPQNEELLFRVGQLYCCNFNYARGEREDNDKAIAAFEKVVNVQKARGDGKYNLTELRALIFLGECYASTRQRDKAIDTLSGFFSIPASSLDFSPKELEDIPAGEREAALTGLRTTTYEDLKKRFEDHIRMVVGPPANPECARKLEELQQRFPNARLLTASNASASSSTVGVSASTTDGLHME